MGTNGVRVSARVVLRHGDTILLIKRSRSNNSNPGRWEIPGGKVELLEETLPALKREVKEETGLIIYPSCTTPLTTVSDEPDHVTQVFLCTCFRRSPGISLAVRLSEEHKDFMWVSVDEALDENLTPTTQEVMEFLLE